MKPSQEMIDALTRVLVDQGKLVEAGWVSFRMHVLPPGVGEAQADDMRAAFFAGAQHLFGSILTMLEGGNEPTDADMERMTKIANELEAYVHDLKVREAKGTMQ